MSDRALKSTFCCLVFLVVATPVLAGDVAVKLDAGSGFVIQNSTGSVQRIRVDEATGNVSRNGALFVHTTGGTFVGSNAGNTTATGLSNTGFGTDALTALTSGNGNAAFGGDALRYNTTGSGNTALGVAALRFNQGGSNNVAVGSASLGMNTSGGNTAVGWAALYYNQTGSGNVAFGNRALNYKTSGNNNIAIGTLAGTNLTQGGDNIYIGNLGVSFNESGRMRIGTAGSQTATFIAGIRGVTTSNANAIPVLVDSAGQLGTLSSSRSVKKDIRDMGDATTRLLELRPVTFRYREQQQTLPDGAEAPPEYGLIAEEVAEIFPDLVVYDEQGKPFTVKYHELAPMLLNEMKRQQREHARQMVELTARVAELEEKLGRTAEPKSKGSTLSVR